MATEIWTMADLDLVRNNLDGDFIQMADIDCGGAVIRPIGWRFTAEQVSPPPGVISLNGYWEEFNGNYNGNGFKISNFVLREDTLPSFTLIFAGKEYRAKEARAIGLFTALKAYAVIRNLTIENAYVYAPTVIEIDAGILVGVVDYEEHIKISNCKVINSELYAPRSQYCGGLAGRLTSGGFDVELRNDSHRGYVSDCLICNCKIYGAESVGGFIGWPAFLYIDRCAVLGTEIIGSSYYMDSNGLETDTSISGFLGENWYSAYDTVARDCTIQNCKFGYDEAVLKVTGAVGGFSSVIATWSDPDCDIGYRVERCLVANNDYSGVPSSQGFKWLLPGGFTTEDTHYEIEDEPTWYSFSNNYYALEDTGRPDYTDPEVAKGLTALQVIDRDAYVGFDFDSVWDISPVRNGGVPMLRVHLSSECVSMDLVKMNPPSIVEMLGKIYIDWGGLNG